MKNLAPLSFTSQEKDIVSKVKAITEALDIDAYVVGGWIRDKLLGLQPHDIDIMVAHDAWGITQALAKKYSLPTPIQYDRSGAIGVRFGEQVVEFIDAERYYTPVTESFQDISMDLTDDTVSSMDDAMRRDCTINALRYNIRKQKLEDPTGKGLKDLENSIIRTIIDPFIKFKYQAEDMIRLARLAATKGFTIDSLTMKGMQANAFRIKPREKGGTISNRRIRKELRKATETPESWVMMKSLLADLGLTDILIDDIKDVEKDYLGTPDEIPEKEATLLVLRRTAQAGAVGATGSTPTAADAANTKKETNQTEKSIEKINKGLKQQKQLQKDITTDTKEVKKNFDNIEQTVTRIVGSPEDELIKLGIDWNKAKKMIPLWLGLGLGIGAIADKLGVSEKILREYVDPAVYDFLKLTPEQREMIDERLHGIKKQSPTEIKPTNYIEIEGKGYLITHQFVVDGTIYHARAGQTDASPFHPADPKIDLRKIDYSNYRIAALSRNLSGEYGKGPFHFGDKIKVIGGDNKVNGIWNFHDHMGKTAMRGVPGEENRPVEKLTDRIDFLMPDDVKGGSWPNLVIQRLVPVDRAEPSDYVFKKAQWAAGAELSTGEAGSGFDQDLTPRENVLTLKKLKINEDKKRKKLAK